jgi:outer membrane protein assembly factor BamB
MRYAAMIGLLAAMVASTGWSAERAWPCWRGPNGDGTTADTGRKPIDSFAQAKRLWISEDAIPGTYEGDARKPKPRLQARIAGGYSSPVVADGRVYLFYYVPHGPVYSQALVEKHVSGGGMGREQWYIDADEVIHCFDADTGKTLWKHVAVETGFNLEGGFNKGGGQFTPCIHQGKVFAIGPSAHLYAVDAETGAPVWESDLGARATWMRHRTDGWREAQTLEGGRNDFAGCVMAVDGVVAVSDHNEFKNGPRGYGTGNGLVGFDADTGKCLWYAPGLGGRGMLGSTPLCWEYGGKSYFIASGNLGVGCIEAQTGKVVWRIEDASFSNATAVSGNNLICNYRGDSRGLACYRISPTGAQRRWLNDKQLTFSSPAVYQGHVFTLAKEGRKTLLVCLDLESGRKTAQVEHDGVVGSLTAADGRIFLQASNRAKEGVSMINADPQDLKRLGGVWPVPYGNSTSPALADGRLYFRGRDHLICYQVTQ